MINLAQISTGLLFYAYDEIHQVRTLVFDNYQTCTVPLKGHVALDRVSWSMEAFQPVCYKKQFVEKHLHENTV